MQFNTISIKKQDADKLIAAQKLFFNTQNQSRIGDLVAQELYVKQNRPLLEKLEAIEKKIGETPVSTKTPQTEKPKQLDTQEKIDVMRKILKLLKDTDRLQTLEEVVASGRATPEQIDQMYLFVRKLYKEFREKKSTSKQEEKTEEPEQKPYAKMSRPELLQTYEKKYGAISRRQRNLSAIRKLTKNNLISLLEELDEIPTQQHEKFIFDVAEMAKQLPSPPKKKRKSKAPSVEKPKQVKVKQPKPTTEEEEEQRILREGVEEEKVAVSGDGIGQMMLDLASLQAGNNSPVVIKRAITALYNNKMIKKRVMNRLMKEYLK